MSLLIAKAPDIATKRGEQIEFIIFLYSRSCLAQLFG